jgi:hypothetical protein
MRTPSAAGAGSGARVMSARLGASAAGAGSGPTLRPLGLGQPGLASSRLEFRLGLI